MLLVVDVGNTHITLGVFDGKDEILSEKDVLNLLQVQAVGKQVLHRK